MADLLKEGADWLAEVFPAQVSQTAVYRRMAMGEQPETEVAVTLGQSDIQVIETSGLVTSFQSIDFIVTASLLTGWIAGFEPMVGDRITYNGRTYEVQNVPGARCFDFTDPYETAFRIHTKLIDKGT